jgi:hypothetical protein
LDDPDVGSRGEVDLNMVSEGGFTDHAAKGSVPSGTPEVRTDSTLRTMRYYLPYDDSVVLAAASALNVMSKTEPSQHAWMEFRAQMKDELVRVLLDTGASHSFLSKRVAERLNLKVGPHQGTVNLEGGKTLPSFGKVRTHWKKGDWECCTDFIVLDMQKDMILGKDFWIRYKVMPDYDTFGVRISRKGREYHLSGVDEIPYAPQQSPEHIYMLTQEMVQAECVCKTAYRRIIRESKGQVEQCLYFLRVPEETSSGVAAYDFSSSQYTPDLNVTELDNDPASTLSPLKKTTGNPELDKKLGPLLDVFREELPAELPPSRAYDHAINTREEAPVNKPYFSLSPEKLRKQTKQIWIN